MTLYRGHVMLNKKKKTLEIIEEELTNLSRDVHNQNVIDHHLDYIKDLVKKDIPTQIIKEILDDNIILEMIAKRSYEHVNHFDKIVLVDNKDPKGFRLTLHSWNCNYGKEIPDQELIHNHRFSFWSHIFRGNLGAETFSETKPFSIEKKTFNKYIYRPSNTGNVHTCSLQEKAQLNKLLEITQTQGETYYLRFNTIHRILLPESGVNLCTFVLRGPREREYTNTYNTFYPDRGINSNVPMMQADQLECKLKKILGDSV
jgi:hypothetical protein